MVDFYFGSSSPDFAASWSPYGGGSGTSVLNKDAALTLTVPAGGITITELQRGMDSAAGQAGTTVQIGVYDITGNPANPPLLGSATISSRSDNAGYVWHTVSGLNINVAAGKVIAIGSALPSAAVWHTRGAEISDAGAATTTIPSPWADSGPAREIPLRAGYSLNTPPATIYDINGNNVVRVGSTGNTISTAGMGTLTSITLGGKAATNLNAPGGDGPFDMPGFVDGASYSLMGSVTAVATDGTNSDDLAVTLYPPIGYDYVTLAGTLNTSNTGVLYQFSPAAAVGGQIVFPLACIVDAQGNLLTDVDGSQTLYYITPAGVVYQFTLTTGTGSTDTTPDAFSFNTPPAAALGATVTSSNTTITGINSPAAVSVTGGLVSINGGAFVSSGTITGGQTIAARVTASNSYSTGVTATVNIGGVTANFTATTIADPGPAPDTTPDSITFPASTNCVAGSAQASAVRSITGINKATPITAATNCTYSIAGGAALRDFGKFFSAEAFYYNSLTGGTAVASATSANGSAVNNQSIQLFANASNTPGASVNASITIGGQVFTWVITTAVALESPPPQSETKTFGQLKGISMPVQTSNAARNLSQASTQAERTMVVNSDKQQSFKMLLFIEKNESATGTVELYAKLLTAKNPSLVGSVDLSAITEISVTETGGPIVSVMAVPIGVSGTFDFSFAGF